MVKIQPFCLPSPKSSEKTWTRHFLKLEYRSNHKKVHKQVQIGIMQVRAEAQSCSPIPADLFFKLAAS